jgi:L-alanine-DL-glutamate epimerase-like enolase superfamily enzyme
VRIVSAETSVVEIPFSFPGTGLGITSSAWRSLEFALVRLEDEQGNVGWGEGFGYFTADATKAMMDRLLVPRVVGAEIGDVRTWNAQAQRDVHLFGRYGVTVFAISGIDIALWDLTAKRAGQPLWAVLAASDATPARGGATPSGRRTAFSCYASLMRYGDAELAVSAVRDARAAGHTAVKLHETGITEIAACREALGAVPPLSVDVNCQWTAAFIEGNRALLQRLNLAWLEEPVFPPEDYAGLARLRSPDLPLAAGENWCTARQFESSGDAVDIWQPSVTKVGGISEYLKIIDAAARQGPQLIPHCPYFGPGYLATLHLAASCDVMDNIEVLWAQPDAWLCEVDSLRNNDTVAVPQGPGLGFEPDPGVFERYRRA